MRNGPFSRHSFHRAIGAGAVAAALLFGAFCPASPAEAQENADTAPPPPVYQQLFPTPTGENGYEEITQAIDALRGAKTTLTFVRGEDTLEQRRVYLADPAVRRALTLMRQGLAKPIHSPRPEMDFSTTFPDLAGVRNLARVLTAEIYVSCADGRTEQAVSSLNDGLRLGYVVKSEAIIGSLVGCATDSLLLEAFIKHREQWSVGDCRRILSVAQQFLDAPDPSVNAMEMERLALVKAAQQLMASAEKGDVDEAIRSIGGGDYSDPNDVATLRKDIESLHNDPNVRESVTVAMATRINADVDAAVARMKDPLIPHITAANEPAAEGATALAGRLLGMVSPTYGGVTTRMQEDRIRVRLLAVHTALRRWRWENGVLPASLEELQQPKLITDPFTGKPLGYKRLSDTEYELFSAGAAPEEPGAKRQPLQLPRPVVKPEGA